MSSFASSATFGLELDYVHHDGPPIPLRDRLAGEGARSVTGDTECPGLRHRPGSVVSCSMIARDSSSSLPFILVALLSFGALTPHLVSRPAPATSAPDTAARSSYTAPASPSGAVGRIAWNFDLVSKVAVYVLLPLLILFASQFPGSERASPTFSAQFRELGHEEA